MKPRLRLLCFLCAPAVALGAGCNGSISGVPGGDPGGPGNGNGNGGPGNGGPGTVPNTTGPAAQPGAGSLTDQDSVPGTAPIRRLTKLEYDNTVRDLLGIDLAVARALQVGNDAESGNAGFVRGASITGGDDARNLLTASGQIVEAVVPRLGSLLPCSPIPTGATEQEACASKFIDQFGKRAYRRPLSAREGELALALYRAQRSPEVGADFATAMGAVIAGFLQAPQFLYHWELGPSMPIKEGNLIRYNSFEVASRLSYLLWTSMPDDQLFAAAEANALNTPEQIAQQAQRLLADERAKAGLADFYLQWMEIGALTQNPKDGSLKDFTPAVAQAMLDETRDFVAKLYQGGAPTLDNLLTSTSTVVGPELAKIYGANASGAGAKDVTLDAAQRAGIFTQLGFLTAHADPGDSHPIKRSDALLRRLLCMEMAVPDTIEVPPVGEPNPNQTTRERFDVHSASPCATACHTILDPVGFAFEGYDAIGAYRTVENGKPIDSTGTVTLDGQSIKFASAVELLKAAAKLPAARSCMTRQWTRYMLGRKEVDGEKPSIGVLEELFAKSNGDLRELLVGLTRTRSFTHRTLSPGEVSQ
jgi:hypothetical protein